MINTNEWTHEIPIIFQALSNMLLYIMSWLIFLITLIILQMARVRLTEIISFIYSTNIYPKLYNVPNTVLDTGK